MESYTYSPIIIFAYNRGGYLRQTLEALEKNAEAKHSLLYIFCDGYKVDSTDEDRRKIDEVRAIAKEEKGFKKVTVIESEKNNGLSKAIISGVNAVLEKHEKVIVLEDDLVTSPYFLDYMNTALNKYKNVDEVISVVGYNYPVKYEDDFRETFFLNTADCLGWGTWRRGWSLFESDAQKLVDKIENLNLTNEFNFNNQYQYMKLLKNVALGIANSWAIRWYASAFINKKLTLFPKKSLVRHIGNIGTNVKADNSDIFGWDISMDPVSYYETQFVEDKSARFKLAMHFRKYNRRRISISTVKYIYKRFILSMFTSAE